MCNHCNDTDTTYANEDYIPVFKLYRVSLKLRQTHKYVDAYRHLDRERTIGTVTVIQKDTTLLDDSDPCEPTRTMMLVYVRLNRDINTDATQPLVGVAEVKQAIKDTFSHSGCAHEYDCCGCVSTHVSEVLALEYPLDPKDVGFRYVVITQSSRNY